MWITSRYELGHKRQSSNPLIVVTGVLIFVGVLTLVVIIATHKAAPIPATIRKQADFSLYYPDKPWVVAKDSIMYSNQGNIVTMTATQAKTHLTISQQATPDQFNDIPQYYPTLLDKLHKYDGFGTVNGTVYLTHPQELQGATEAVLNNNGTFMIVYTNTNLPRSTWRELFSNMTIIK